MDLLNLATQVSEKANQLLEKAQAALPVMATEEYANMPNTQETDADQ